MPETVTLDHASLPAKGSRMADVKKKFGEPSSKQPTVGGDTKKHPPITRWDYPNFSVIFEKDQVIDAVIPGAPPAIYHQDELQPVASAPPMPGAAMAPADAASVAPAAETTPAPADPMEPAQPATGTPVATPENPNPDRPPQ